MNALSCLMIVKEKVEGLDGTNINNVRKWLTRLHTVIEEGVYDKYQTQCLDNISSLLKIMDIYSGDCNVEPVVYTEVLDFITNNTNNTDMNKFHNSLVVFNRLKEKYDLTNITDDYKLRELHTLVDLIITQEDEIKKKTSCFNTSKTGLITLLDAKSDKTQAINEALTKLKADTIESSYGFLDAISLSSNPQDQNIKNKISAFKDIFGELNIQKDAYGTNKIKYNVLKTVYDSMLAGIKTHINSIVVHPLSNDTKSKLSRQITKLGCHIEVKTKIDIITLLKNVFKNDVYMKILYMFYYVEIE